MIFKSQCNEFIQEDLEKLIESAEKGSEKDNLAESTTSLGDSTPTTKAEAKSIGKPAEQSTPVNEPAAPSKSEKSEKEVKFKLPPEDIVDEEEIVEEEEEVELVRPPTPPKSLSKAKPKSVRSFLIWHQHNYEFCQLGETALKILCIHIEHL